MRGNGFIGQFGRGHARETAGHVTEEMQRHYSTVDVAEVRAAMHSAMAVLTIAAEAAAAAKRKAEGVNAGVN